MSKKYSGHAEINFGHKDFQIEQFVSECSFWTPDYFSNSAWIEHAPFAFWLMDKLQPKKFVELGTHFGFSYFAFCQANKILGLGAETFAIDTWLGDEHAGFYDESVFSIVSAQNILNYRDFSKLIRCDFCAALEKFDDSSIDLLHIDGRHFYEDVKMDYTLWRKKLTENAVILFHDTNVYEREFGVWKFFAELASKHPSFQFDHGYGLGVIAVGEIIPKNLQPLFNCDLQAAKNIKNIYSALGKSVAARCDILSINDALDSIIAHQGELSPDDARRIERFTAGIPFIRKIVDDNFSINNKNQKIHELENEIKNKNHNIISLENNCSELKNMISAIKNSTSWKISYPVRIIGNFITKKKNKNRNMNFEIIEKKEEYRVEESKITDILDSSISLPIKYQRNLDSFTFSVATIVHIFHLDTIDQIRFYLENLPKNSDIYISTSSDHSKRVIERHFLGWNKGSINIRVTQNRGRDIAPKLIEFKDVYERYDLILHLHSKKSNHDEGLSCWRHFLFETLVGSEEIVSSIFEIFRSSAKIGIVAPQHFDPLRHHINWGDNFAKSVELASKFGLQIEENTFLDFPSGSMFWMRGEALRPLLDLGLTFSDFEEEKGQVDGTLAHAIERLYFFSCEKAGFAWIKVGVPEFFLSTEGIKLIGSEDDLKNYVGQYNVSVLDKNIISQNQAEMRKVCSKISDGLINRAQSHKKYKYINQRDFKKTSFGVIFSESENKYEIINYTRLCAALNDVAHMNNREILVLNAGVHNVVEYCDQVKFLEYTSSKPLNFFTGHNFLMRYAFGSGADNYIALDSSICLDFSFISDFSEVINCVFGSPLIGSFHKSRGVYNPRDEKTLEARWLSGEWMSISKNLYDDIGGFDEDCFAYFADIDFSWRAAAHGYALRTLKSSRKIDDGEAHKFNYHNHIELFISAVILAKRWNLPNLEAWARAKLTKFGVPCPTVQIEPIPIEWKNYHFVEVFCKFIMEGELDNSYFTR